MFPPGREQFHLFGRSDFLFSLGLNMGVWDLYLSVPSHYTHTHVRTYMLTCAHTGSHTHALTHTHGYAPAIEPQAWLWALRFPERGEVPSPGRGQRDGGEVRWGSSQHGIVLQGIV